MRRFIVFVGEDEKQTALETSCIQKLETTEVSGHCLLYYYDAESKESKVLYIRGT